MSKLSALSERAQPAQGEGDPADRFQGEYSALWLAINSGIVIRIDREILALVAAAREEGCRVGQQFILLRNGGDFPTRFARYADIVRELNAP